MHAPCSINTPRLFALVAAIAILFPVMSSDACAQQGAVIGTVVDASTGDTMAGVNVALPGTVYGAATAADGSFRIGPMPYGTYLLRASFIGYGTAEQSVVVDAAEVRISISLAESRFVGEEIVVSGSLKPEKLTDTPATIEVLSAADIQFVPAYNTGELLARLKGVDYFRAGIATPAINVRGFNSNFNAKNLQVTDGRISTLIATGLPMGPLDTVSPEDIERQEVVLGPNGALFGPNAHNGLVNTITKDPRTSEGTIVNLRAGNQSTVAGSVRHAQVLNERVAFKANLEYSRAEEFEFADSVYIGGVGFEEYKLDNGVEFLKGSAAGYFNVRPGTDLIVNYGGSNSTYLSPTNVGRNQIIDWRIHQFQTRLVAPKFFVQAYYTVSRTDDTYAIDQRTKDYWGARGRGLSEADAEAASLAGEAVFVDDSRRINAEAQYRDTFGRLELTAGVQWQKDMANSHGTYLLDEDEDDSIDINQVGGYGQASVDLTERYRAVVAFRADNHDIYDFNFLPKFALLRIGQYGTWRATYGQGIAAPTILNMYGNLFGGLILGNAEGFTMADGRSIPKQKVEKLQTFEVGYKGQLQPGTLFVDANAYYNRSENFLSPFTVLGVATHRGDTPVSELQSLYAVWNGLVGSYVNFGRFDTYGLDVGLTYLVSDAVSATINYSFFDISFDEDDLEENDFNNDGVVNKLDHLVNAPNHKGSLALNYKDPKWFGTAFFRWVQAYDYFSSYQIAAETQDLIYRGRPVVEDARSSDTWNYGPLGGFVQVDLGAGYQVTPQFRVSAQVSNLLDSEIREFTASPFIGRLISAGVRVEL